MVAREALERELNNMGQPNMKYQAFSNQTWVMFLYITKSILYPSQPIIINNVWVTCRNITSGYTSC